MKKLFMTLLLGICCLGNASDKIYIDEDEFKQGQDAFYVHMGNNVWIHTNSVHRDETGLFTYESSVARSVKLVSGYECAYEKKWRCPYCYNYWPIGTACQNADCPSKYKIAKLNVKK